MLNSASVPGAPSGLMPVIGTFSGVGFSASFSPVPGREFYISASGTFIGSVRLLVRFNGSGTWLPLVVTGMTMYTLEEPGWLPVELSEHGIEVRLECTSLASGAIDYRISQ